VTFLRIQAASLPQVWRFFLALQIQVDQKIGLS